MQVTADAVSHVRSHLLKRGKGIGIRLGLKKSGCSGFAYTIQCLDKINEDDIVEKNNDIVVCYDKKYQQHFSAVNLDFNIDGLNQGLTVINPREISKCGCGKSVGF